MLRNFLQDPFTTCHNCLRWTLALWSRTVLHIKPIHIILLNMQITIITVDWWWNIARDYRHYFSYANLYYHINENIWGNNLEKTVAWWIYGIYPFQNSCEFFMNLCKYSFVRSNIVIKWSEQKKTQPIEIDLIWIIAFIELHQCTGSSITMYQFFIYIPRA